ncbi:hypothetical protein, partial [Streptococcus pyogenes]|uniref:hypothetical protein n=1 Tax=Streptococcus pyogenes TaxID=1314 RepID=UPI00165304B4
MALTNQLFQVEVGKAFGNHQNLFLNSTTTKGIFRAEGVIERAYPISKEVTSDFISVAPHEKIVFQHWVTLSKDQTAWSVWQFFDKNKKPISPRGTGIKAFKATVG